MKKLIARFAELPDDIVSSKMSASLISDCVEAVGHKPTTMSSGLVPFYAEQFRTFVGPAHTCQVRRTDEWIEIDRLLETVDATPSGSIVVVGVDEFVPGALWGGLMSTRVSMRGGIAAIVDGGVRDLKQISDLGFPVFASFTSPLDIRGRAEVVAHSVPVECRGVTVNPGDIVVADLDGVVVVPRSIEGSVLAAFLKRIEAETLTEEELLNGSSAQDVYRRHKAF